MSPSPDILPSSRLQRPTGALHRPGGWWIPIACANCGADGGFVPEDNASFAFYLCNNCADRWGPIANTYSEPDALFWERIHKGKP